MITDIRLLDFRSYHDDSFEFSPSVNIIVGPNASGKTNLLESILVIASGGSFRTKDIELIAHDRPWARLEALVNNSDSRVVLLKRFGDRANKQFKINDTPYARLALTKKLPVVLFEPNHLDLIAGPPDVRRQFLDDSLEQMQPGYSILRRQYARVLAQRNALLKSRQTLLPDQLFVWNVRLSEFGQQIVQGRDRLVTAINSRLTELYRELSQVKATATIRYIGLAKPEVYATELIKYLEKHQITDTERGFTGRGPHREDMQILLNGHPAALTASRGESRTLILAFKMIEAELLEQARGNKPLLLFDDVFSELDGHRRQALTRFLQPYQTFITTTDADVVVQHFAEETNVIPLSKETL